MKWLNKVIVVLLVIGFAVAGMSTFVHVESPQQVNAGDICETSTGKPNIRVILGHRYVKFDLF
jgi:hypothetical protein